MNQRFCLFIGILYTLLFTAFEAKGQGKIAVSGHLLDFESKMEVVGAHVFIDSTHSIISDPNGNFSYELTEGEHRFQISFIGYNALDTVLNISKEIGVIQFELIESNNMLDVMVVSDSRYSHKYERSTISIDVISPDELKTKSPIDVQKTIEQLPSVHMIGDQMNIRGGSGWTYGAGSRVLLLQDGVPMMEGAEAGIQWYSIEPEATHQIELIKGSSSVLYGASALNGTINIQTRKPSETPHTSISILHGIYDSPSRTRSDHNSDIDSVIIGDITNQPDMFDTVAIANNGQRVKDWNSKSFPLTFSNYTIYHDQKIGNLELSGSYNYFREQNYIQNNKENKRHRVFGKIAHDLKKEHGLYYGLSGTYIDNLKGESFLYNGDQDPYRSFKEVTYNLHSREFAIRPFLEIGREDSKWNHKFNGQFYHVGYVDTITNFSTLYYGNYQSQVKMGLFTVTFGGNGSYVKGETTSSNLKAHQFNIGAYLQTELRLEKFSAVGGVRYEYNNENGHVNKEPIFRLAGNYELSKKTFLKASYGEAIRFPSLFEKYFQRNAGEITFLPNRFLEPEKGWTSEIGIIQKYKLGQWSFSSELNGFIMKFQNMTELGFGIWGGDDVNATLNPLGVGFKAINVGETRVTGLEINTRGYGKVGQVELDFKFGYTYMNPIPLDKDFIYESYTDQAEEIANNLTTDFVVRSVVKSIIETIGNVTYTSTSTDPSILKYRYEHLFNLDLGLHYKKFHPSVNMRYNSYMKNVDNLFESYMFNANVRDLFSTVSSFDGVDLLVQDMQIAESRKRNKNGDWLFDVRLAYDISDKIRVMFAVENVFNHEFQIRPAQIGSPRKFTLQTNIRL